MKKRVAANKKTKDKNKVIKHKKGVSVIIGYVLLVVFAIGIGAIVYQWLATFVPSESLTCTDGVSLFLEEATYDEATSELSLTIRNNGRFDIAGYFAYGSNVSGEEANIELFEFLVEDDSDSIVFGNSILVAGESNSFSPNEQIVDVFDIDSETGEISSVRLIPTRFQEVDEISRFLSCTNARVSQEVTPPSEGVEGFEGDEGGLMDDDGGGGGGSGEEVQLYYFGFEGSGGGGSEQGWVAGCGIGGCDDSNIENNQNRVDNNGVIDQGDWSWHLQDNTDDSTVQQGLDFSGGYSQIRIQFWGYWESIDNNDCVELQIDGNLVDDWGGNGCNNEVSGDAWLQQSVLLDSSDFTFDSSVQVKYESEMGDDGDDLYLDGINITGII